MIPLHSCDISLSMSLLRTNPRTEIQMVPLFLVCFSKVQSYLSFFLWNWVEASVHISQTPLFHTQAFLKAKYRTDSLSFRVFTFKLHTEKSLFLSSHICIAHFCKLYESNVLHWLFARIPRVALNLHINLYIFKLQLHSNFLVLIAPYEKLLGFFFSSNGNQTFEVPLA